MKTLKLIPIHTDHPDYDFCEQLYLSAFPPTERRNKEQQRVLTDENPDFYCCILSVNDKAVGFITYWEFDTFVYIEHFAIEPSMRGKNIGSQVLNLVHAKQIKPVILEVERPDTDIARRRISFYERCGYKLWTQDYLQPPYQEGYPLLPLYLMCHGNLTEEQDFNSIKALLYQKVYRYNKSNSNL